MSDFDCDFGDCDCECDFDCCSCCCCPDFDGCFDDCCSLDGNNLCCCIICIGSSNDSNRHKRDSNLLPWLCCCDYGRRRTTYSEEPWMKDPRGKSANKEEKEKKKKEPGSKQATYGSCYSCHGPIDVSPRYKHQYDSFNWNKEKCSRCSSMPPPPFEPPSIQQFRRLDQEKYVRRPEMYS